jgi:mono/diheme cytochrome c family protein
MRTHLAALLLALAASALAACRQDMHDQPRLKPYGKSTFFADGRANRPLIAGTVARGRLFEDEHLHLGKLDGKEAATFPMPITKEVLARGRERYTINCQPCHGILGDGNGMIVQRGMKRPPSYHIDRLREAAPGYFFGVITNGFGVMYDYSDRIRAEDRWAIVAYVRALQQSQSATIDDVPQPERDRLMRGE